MTDSLPILVLCLALSACGGGGSSPVQQASASKLIEVYSDSTGLSVGTDGRNWPEKLSIPGYTVRNLSQGGIGALHVLPGSERFGVKPWSVRMAESKAGTIIIGLAINDAVNTDAVTYSNNLKTLIDIAKESGKRVILQTPNQTNIPAVSDFAEIMRGLETVIDQDANLRPWTAALTRDGVHPVPDVVDKMGRFAQARLLEVLK